MKLEIHNIFQILELHADILNTSPAPRLDNSLNKITSNEIILSTMTVYLEVFKELLFSEPKTKKLTRKICIQEFHVTSSP